MPPPPPWSPRRPQSIEGFGQSWAGQSVGERTRPKLRGIEVGAAREPGGRCLEGAGQPGHALGFLWSLVGCEAQSSQCPPSRPVDKA